jgi:hypothetical protein
LLQVQQELLLLQVLELLLCRHVLMQLQLLLELHLLLYDYLLGSWAQQGHSCCQVWPGPCLHQLGVCGSSHNRQGRQTHRTWQAC